DITSENIIIELLRELAEAGRTILIVHHDLSKIYKYFDGLILLNKTLIACGSVSEVYTAEHVQEAFGTNIVVSPYALKKEADSHDQSIYQCCNGVQFPAKSVGHINCHRCDLRCDRLFHCIERAVADGGCHLPRRPAGRGNFLYAGHQLFLRSGFVRVACCSWHRVYKPEQ